EDDLNTPKALAAIFGAMSSVGTQLFSMPQEARENLAKFMTESLNSLGIDTTLPIISDEARKLALERETLRRNQQFMQSDALRKSLDDLGYVVEDTPAGPFLWPK
ncbi:MAG: hypothetical protein Q7S28_04095, partial [bacterium]|nr:hypothetical protein [bacterium]